VATNVDPESLGILKVSRARPLALLKPVYRVHHALELRPINQIECALFARKHFQRCSPRGRNHSRSFFRGQIARRDCVERQMNENAQAPNASTFLVDLFLGGREQCSILRGFRIWPEHVNDYELRFTQAQ